MHDQSLRSRTLAGILEARKQSREALGRDPGQGDMFDAPPKKKPAAYVPLVQPSVEPRPSEAVGVFTLGEAAARLGLSRAELEAMIDAGRIEALPTGYTRVIPTGEVERIIRSRR